MSRRRRRKNELNCIQFSFYNMLPFNRKKRVSFGHDKCVKCRVGKNPGIGRFRDPGSGSGFPGESRGIPFFKFVEIKEKIV